MSRELLHYMVDEHRVSESLPVEHHGDQARKRNILAAIRAMTYRERRKGAHALCHVLLRDHALMCSFFAKRFREPWHEQDRTAYLASTWEFLITFWQIHRMLDWLDRRYELGLSASPPKLRRRRR